MVARSDPGDYGKLEAFTMPTEINVKGPAQAWKPYRSERIEKSRRARRPRAATRDGAAYLVARQDHRRLRMLAHADLVEQVERGDDLPGAQFQRLRMFEHGAARFGVHREPSRKMALGQVARLGQCPNRVIGGMRVHRGFLYFQDPCVKGERRGRSRSSIRFREAIRGGNAARLLGIEAR